MLVALIALIFFFISVGVLSWDSNSVEEGVRLTTTEAVHLGAAVAGESTSGCTDHQSARQ